MLQMKEQDKKPRRLNKQRGKQAIYLKKNSESVIVKMIPNLRNRIEAWVEKIQEMFNKDL